MKIADPIPRRAFLRGLGTMMALPVLESLSPGLASAASAASPMSGASPFPRRMAFVYIPNGVNMADWTPATVGADFELPMILDPLKSLRDEFSLVTGLAHNNANALGDGGGDHARAAATYLTGMHPRKTAGADIRAGISVDQIAAMVIGDRTKLPSIELSCDKGAREGACESGYSCAYQFNLSWRSPTQPVNPEVNPRAAFERLFGSLDPEENAERIARRKLYRRSLLDFVMTDAQAVSRQIGAADRAKVDEYMTAVREIERRIERAEQFNVSIPEGARIPSGVIDHTYREHLRLMYDILVLAFQSDATRIGTFITAHDGSNRPYPFIGISDGHHDLTHHRNDEEKKAKVARINRFHVEQFAYFLERLRSIPEGEGTLLDNCAILYGSGISEGNSHDHDNLPLLLAGRGGGGLKTGRHIAYEGDPPAANLFLSMLENVGAPQERFGDSTGMLKEILA